MNASYSQEEDDAEKDEARGQEEEVPLRSRPINNGTLVYVVTPSLYSVCRHLHLRRVVGHTIRMSHMFAVVACELLPLAS